VLPLRPEHLRLALPTTQAVLPLWLARPTTQAVLPLRPEHLRPLRPGELRKLLSWLIL
jgi:hypothetical protein